MRTVPWDERVLRVVHGDGIMSGTFKRVIMMGVFLVCGRAAGCKRCVQMRF